MGKRGSYIEIGSILNVDMAALLPQDCFILGNNLLQVKIFRMLYNVRNKAFWARRYYVTTVGNVMEDTIKRYIQEQYNESKEEDGAAFERQ